MMHLSTLWRIDQTIRDDGSSPVAEALLIPWHPDPGTLRFVRSSANFVYRFHQNGAPCFLRFADAMERTRAKIEAEVDLLHWITRQEIAVARPIPSRHDALVETITTDQGDFHAVVFGALTGEQLDIDDLDLPRFHAWGAALGRLHAAMRRCPDTIVGRRQTLQDQLAEARQWFSADDRAVHAELTALTGLVDVLPRDADRYGLIHGDFELDNLVWNDGIAALDFDDCLQGWYAADIAFALRDVADDFDDPDSPAIHAFIEGYQLHMSVDADVRHQLILFRRVANCLIAARIRRSLDLDEQLDYPEWLNRLIGIFHQHADAYVRSLADPSTGG